MLPMLRAQLRQQNRALALLRLLKVTPGHRKWHDLMEFILSLCCCMHCMIGRVLHCALELVTVLWRPKIIVT